MWQRSNRGFTLLELIVTVAVAAILLAIAVPSYRSMVERDSLAAAMNNVVGALNYARSQAVTRDATVCVCARQSDGQCSEQGDWQNGTIVYLQQNGECAMTPSAQVGSTLRVESGMGTNFRMQSASATPIYFNSNGFSMTGQSIEAGRPDADYSQAICIAATGRVEVSSTPACSQ